MGVLISLNKNLRERLYQEDDLRFLVVEDKKMDKYSKRFLWLASQMLSECELDDATEQSELRDISRRLREMAISIADDVSCERISQEMEQMKRRRPAREA